MFAVIWRNSMLHWALVFLVVALVAATFGFGPLASFGIAQIIFVVALTLFVVSVIFAFLQRGRH